MYLSQSGLDRSLNAVCIKGLKQNGVNVESFGVSKGLSGLFDFEALNLCRQSAKKADFIIVGNDSPALVIFLKFFCRKKIIYNAFRSIYEGLIISRALASRFSPKAVYYWLLDFIAVHFANLILVETDHQADYFRKIFKVSRKKICRSWIGVDENRFFYDSAAPKFDVFTVLFRGALMPEAGVEYVVRAAKILEDKNIKFIIIGGGILLEEIKKIIEEMNPANLRHITDYMSDGELRTIMQKCHLSLGQFSDHDRLTRTIPHKAYESLAMKLPYLTAFKSGILELLTPDKTCLTCDPASAKSLAEKILWVQNNYLLAEKIAENGYELYQNQLKSHILAKNLLDRMTELY